jgi:hypothetical protein
MRNYRDCKAVALKEYYNYSPISTCTERFSIFLRNNSDCKDVDLYHTHERDMQYRKFQCYEKHILASELVLLNKETQ